MRPRFTSSPIDARILTQEPRRIAQQSHGRRLAAYGHIEPMAVARRGLFARIVGMSDA